jgi:spore coat protein U-like protein
VSSGDRADGGWRRRFVAAALAAGSCMFTVTPAGAAGCSLNAPGVAFGIYDALASASLDGAGTISVSCDAFASYTLALSPGQGTMAARRLQSCGSVLFYNLYTDALRAVVWGDGSGGTALVGGSGTGGSHTVYGRIPARQNVVAGAYSDTIIITLAF